jgi:hypothetical protein
VWSRPRTTFVAAVLRGPAVSAESYAQAEAVLGQRTLVELTVLVGYYRLLAEVMYVFAVGVPGETTPSPEQRHG